MTVSHTPAWATIGLAVREHSALRFDIETGPAAGTWYVSAEDVPGLLEGEGALLYELRHRAGEQVPVEAGYITTSSTGRMVRAELDRGPARFFAPSIAIARHYQSGKATRITVPSEDLEEALHPAIAEAA